MPQTAAEAGLPGSRKQCYILSSDVGSIQLAKLNKPGQKISVSVHDTNLATKCQYVSKQRGISSEQNETEHPVSSTEIKKGTKITYM